MVYGSLGVWLHILDEAKIVFLFAGALFDMYDLHTCEILNRYLTFLCLSLEKQYKLHALTPGAYQYSVSLTLTIGCQFHTRVMCSCCPAHCFYTRILLGSTHLVTHYFKHGGVNRLGLEDGPLPR